MGKNLNKCMDSCPVCGGEMIIKEYECQKCGTVIKGSFKRDKFESISQEDKDFIEVFVLKRGNIKDIEKELGISYPTVRNRLDKAISALGHKVEKDQSKMEILNLLDEGEITLEEATKMLESL